MTGTIEIRVANPSVSTDSSTHDTRLWRGGGDPSVGCLCAMQELSWINGDEEISAHPAGVSPLLAMLVQEVNDHHCTHAAADTRRICHDCSNLVREIATRTRDTHIADDSLTCTIYLAIARRLGINDPDLARHGYGHPLFLAGEIVDRLDPTDATPALAHAVIDWWSAFVRVRTGRIVGLPSTEVPR